MKVGIEADELWPIYSIWQDIDPEFDDYIEIPASFWHEYKQAREHYFGVQKVLELLFKGNKWEDLDNAR